MIKYLILLMFIGLVSCEANDSSDTVSEEINPQKLTQDNGYQIQFVHQFCVERVIIKHSDTIVFDEIVSSQYCKGKKVKKITCKIIPEWKNLVLELPNRNYFQNLIIKKNKNISLYFNDGSKEKWNNAKDTIQVIYWDNTDPPFEM
jgi:hypothetical protein